MYLPNLKFAALPFPEMIAGSQKIWAVPGYTHAPFLPNFSWAFVQMDPINLLPSLKFVPLPIPKIIGGTQKIWVVLVKP